MRRQESFGSANENLRIQAAGDHQMSLVCQQVANGVCHGLSGLNIIELLAI